MSSHPMTPEQARWFATVFPVFFVALWVFITSVIGVASGWYQMMTAYPDRPEAPIQRFSWQSGSMGARVSLQGILRVDVCASGLRFGMMRIFGPFCRDFFVPWGEIAVTPRQMFLVKAVELQFGGRQFPRLLVRAGLADRIAGVAPGQLRLADGAAP
jgi:hypothetical protein